MDHARLGHTGLQVSRLCLGTMTFGLQCDEDTSRTILDRAFDGGITFLDTADVYPLGGDLSTVGLTEEIVGRWMAGKRGDVVLATKCVGPTGRHPWDRGASRRHILAAVDASLARLGTDYIDLYQMHSFDPETPIDETLSALDHLVRSGKVRYVGCSNYLAYQLARAIGRSETLGLARMESVQPRYNLLFRQIERELLPLCSDEGIGVIPYNPIAGGLLTGKHRRDSLSEGRFKLGRAGRMYQDRYWHDREFDSVEELRSVAAREGAALTTLAVQWVLAHPAVSSAIVGASTQDQLTDTLAAAEKPMTAELKAELDEMTAIYRQGDAPALSGAEGSTSRPGPLALVGSGEYLPEMAAFEASLIDGRPRRYLQLATAAVPDGPDVVERWHELGRAQAHRIGVEAVILRVTDRADAENHDLAGQVVGAGLVYLSGGHPAFLADTLRDTAVWSAIVTAWQEGAALAGCSAGAMAMTSWVPTFRGPRQEGTPGLGLLPHMRVIPHFDSFVSRVPDLLERFAAPHDREVTVIGVDEQTAIVGGPNEWAVEGRGSAWVLGPDGRREAPAGTSLSTAATST